jgi:glucose dehydrogenase
VGSGRAPQGVVDREDFPVWSGALATAGDVVFYGTMDGWFKAVDAETGSPAGSTRRPRESSASRLVPRARRQQYVAVLAGVGGWAGAIVSGNLDPRDGDRGGGFVNAMRDLPSVTKKGGMLYVFRLP